MSSIKAIAAKLNITPSTVSHALNQRPGKVSEAMRQRIFAMAKELNYAPNPAARALGSRLTGNIGFVSRNYHNPLYSAIFQEIAVAVDQRGGNLVACVTSREPSDSTLGQNHLLHSRSVDGVLAVPYALPNMDSTDSPWMHGPIVLILPHWSETRAASVRFDDQSGAHQAAEHLWSLGHRQILFLHGLGIHHERSGMGQDRLAFLQKAWRELGGDARDISESEGTADASGGAAALQSALAHTLPFTAVLAYNDSMALGAISVLRERGLQIPHDVSVIGWNDLEETLSYLSPSLTSVRTDPAALAHTALMLLEQQITSQEKLAGTIYSPVLIPVTLTPRGSTGVRPNSNR